MKKNCLLISLLFFTCLSFAQTRNLKLVKTPTENPTTEKRKAVVIGMSDYGASRSLNNTINDADDMANVLTRLGFEVTLLKNNDLRNLRTNLTNWFKTIERNDMAIFYFAGHGMEVNGENFLIPVDAELSSQSDVQYDALNVQWVLNNMDEQRVDMKLLILDACRDNPFKRSWTRGSESKGFAQMSARGTLIAFAASPGSTAQDGGNYNLRNGVFTYYLKQEISKEGVSILEIFTNVTGKVSELTHEQQEPYTNSSLKKNFYIIPPSAPVANVMGKLNIASTGNINTTVYIDGVERSKITPCVIDVLAGKRQVRLIPDNADYQPYVTEVVISEGNITNMNAVLAKADKKIPPPPVDVITDGRELNFVFKGIEKKNNSSIELYMDSQLIGGTDFNKGFQLKYVDAKPGAHKLRVVWTNLEWNGIINTAEQTNFNFECKKKKTGFGYESYFELLK
jgi:hypothetical protein